MTSNQRHASCQGCKALEAYEWGCTLGYRVAALKKFTPREDCPKPETAEALKEARGDDLRSDKTE